MGAILFFLVLPHALLRAGDIVTALLRLHTSFALNLLVGVVTLSLALLIWKVCIPLPVWMALSILAIALVFTPRFIPPVRRDPVCLLEGLAVVIALIAATGWCRDLLPPATTADGWVLFKPWSDFFTHASMVARSQTSQTLLEVGNYEWKGFPAVIYHYASYSLPLALTRTGNVPAYAAVVGFWAPFGSFLLGLAAFSLGRVFWGPSGGLAALAGALLVPDTALLGLGHPLYSYFWLQHIAPAGLYGVAVGATGLILILRGVREGQRRWMVAGVCVALFAALFKIHVFVAEFPLLFSIALLGWFKGKRRAWIILGCFIAVGLTLLSLANHLPIGPGIRFDFSDSGWYWKLLAQASQGTLTQNWYRVFNTGHSFPEHLPQAVALLLISGLGVFSIVAPVTWMLGLRLKSWQTSDGISVAAVAIFLLLTFGISRNDSLGGPEEFMHRPFVWSYWLVSSLTMGRLFSIVARRYPALAGPAVVAAVLCLSCFPFIYGPGLQRGKWVGGAHYTNLHVDRGLVDCAVYVRNQPPKDSVVQDSHFDEFLIFGALSERPSFAARPSFWVRASKAFRETNYKSQLQRLHGLQVARTMLDLKESVHQTGIRWYVVHPGERVTTWPSELRDHPAFESHGYQVYDLSSL